MTYQATVYRVMIASPSDVTAERTIIRDVLYQWNTLHSSDKGIVLLPVGWETHSAPSMEDRAQAIINKQVLADCDLLIGSFWTRIGTPTGESQSGSIEEITHHIKSGKPAMIYFSSVPVVPDSIDQKQYELLKKFKKECLSKGLIESYLSLEEFRDKLYRQITINLSSSDFLVSARNVTTNKKISINKSLKSLLFEDLKSKYRMVNASIAEPQKLAKEIHFVAAIGSQISFETFDRYANSLITLEPHEIKKITRAYDTLKNYVSACSEIIRIVTKKEKDKLYKISLVGKSLPIVLLLDPQGDGMVDLENAILLFEGGASFIEEQKIKSGSLYGQFKVIESMLSEKIDKLL